MAITVGLVAVVGVWALHLSLGASVLLGGILAPTDPVLASHIQSKSGTAPDPVRFSLAAEGALNDGSAFPFVLLGLGMMGLHELGVGGWRWWVVDLLWTIAGGLIIGAVLGMLIGKLVVHLRTRHHSAIGLDAFLSLGLIATSYGIAQLCLASGFLAVFSAGLALHRVREQPLPGTVSLDLAPNTREHGHGDRATHSHHASATMAHAVQGFNEQLERLAELAIVLIIGAMLPYATLSANLLWFIPLLFFILRPVAILAGMTGYPISRRQCAMIGWFGIRGVGSVFYLMYALHHGVSGPLAQELVTITLATVAVSIFAHGVSAVPLMKWYARCSTVTP
jgi:NhaP-type Na+/H+ or K+/H+ antiporter